MVATLRIDLSSTVPAYRQIADGLRAVLVAGQVKAGERLPPVRQLATDLGVHHNTVAEAYRTLADEGWLDLTRQRGATVLKRGVPAPTREAEERFQVRLRDLVAEARSAGVPWSAIAAALKKVPSTS